jgi:hypothetical protein
MKGGGAGAPLAPLVETLVIFTTGYPLTEVNLVTYMIAFCLNVTVAIITFYEKFRDARYKSKIDFIL